PCAPRRCPGDRGTTRRSARPRRSVRRDDVAPCLGMGLGFVAEEAAQLDRLRRIEALHLQRNARPFVDRVALQRLLDDLAVRVGGEDRLQLRLLAELLQGRALEVHVEIDRLRLLARETGAATRLRYPRRGWARGRVLLPQHLVLEVDALARERRL